MRIFNGVNHNLSFFHQDQVDSTDPRRLVLKDNELPYLIIEKSVPLNAKLVDEPNGTTEDGVPLFITNFSSVDPLPEEAGDGDIVVVSMLYGAAYKAAHPEYNPTSPDYHGPKLYGVRGPISQLIDGKPTPAGCLGLQLIR